jgi:predicted RNase H-like HicB family nuclease
MRRYIALLDRDATGGYGVAFPDFPGCVSAGNTLAEAADQAAQALRLHVEGMLDDGDAIPEPRTAEELKEALPDWFEGISTIVLVPLLPPRAGAERLNISLDRNLIREIDATAEAMGLNRSAFLARGAQQLLEAVALAPARRIATSEEVKKAEKKAGSPPKGPKHKKSKTGRVVQAETVAPKSRKRA